MAHYGLTDTRLLAMPLDRFWLLSQNIDRMNASADMRAITVASSVLSADQYIKVTDLLRESLGTVVSRDSVRDVAGIEELKRMLSK